MRRKSIGKPLQYNPEKNLRKEKDLWRYGLSVGDLVEMKVGGLAIVIEVRGDDYEFYGTDALVPRVKVMYCDDSSYDKCSAYRIERILRETR